MKHFTLFFFVGVYAMACNKKNSDSPAPPKDTIATLSRTTIFVPGKDTLYAIDADSAIIRWTVAIGSSTGFAPNYNNGVLIVGRNSLSAFNAKTGKLLWDFRTYTEMSVPAIAYGMVYCSDNYQNFYGIDLKTGTQKWIYSSNTRNTLLQNCSSPTVKDSTVYIGDGRNLCLYAFDAITGKIKWKNSDAGNVISGPCLVNGIIYSNSDRALTAINAATGITKWAIDYSWGYLSPTVANGKLYAGRMLGVISAFDTATGKELWSYPAADATVGIGQIYSSPIVSAGLVYIATSDATPGSAIHAVDAETGLLKWKYPGSFGYWKSPVVYNGKVYIGDGNKLTVLDAVSGTVVWKLALGTSIANSVCIVDTNNKVYLPGDAGDVQ